MTLAQEGGSGSLSWAENPNVSCEGFLEQIKARFGVFGPNLSDIPESLRDELDLALEMACSPRFRHCNFESCGIEVSLDEQKRSKLIEERSRVQKEESEQQKALIARAVKNEQKRRLVWSRFAVPGDRSEVRQNNSETPVITDSTEDRRIIRKPRSSGLRKAPPLN